MVATYREARPSLGGRLARWLGGSDWRRRVVLRAAAPMKLLSERYEREDVDYSALEEEVRQQMASGASV